jgi:hypothetical protein
MHEEKDYTEEEEKFRILRNVSFSIIIIKRLIYKSSRVCND